MKPDLVVLAAGIGSRYGSLKQMDPVGPSGETIIDYSIFDALRAGFGRAVFIIRRSIEADFREVLLRRLAGRIEVAYVFQELEDIPPGSAVPAGRTKPWGTAHAVLKAGPEIRGPFAVINADDFYGPSAFGLMARFLAGVPAAGTEYALIGYALASTLSEHGTVARGVCDLDGSGDLAGIVERTRIGRGPDGIFDIDDRGRRVALGPDKVVSMNFWGFTPSFLGFAESVFRTFLAERGGDPKAELYIPLVVNEIVRRGKAKVRVLPTAERWFGVTYKEDRARVVEELRGLVSAGVYPARLWP